MPPLVRNHFYDNPVIGPLKFCCSIIDREVMVLSIGTQLGSHEITALLGKGGVGEAYRARDLKLKRDVAIKVLPEEFAHDSDRVSCDGQAVSDHAHEAGGGGLEQAELMNGDGPMTGNTFGRWKRCFDSPIASSCLPCSSRKMDTHLTETNYGD